MTRQQDAVQNNIRNVWRVS